MGVIVTKKTQGPSLKHRTGGVNLLDLAAVQRGTIEYIIHVLSREILCYGKNLLPSPANKFVSTWFSEYKSNVNIEDKIKIVVKMIVESIAFTPDDKINVQIMTKRAFEVLNDLDRNLMVDIVMTRVVLPKFTFNQDRTSASTGVKVDGNIKTSDVIDLSMASFVSSKSCGSSLKRSAAIFDIDNSPLKKHAESLATATSSLFNDYADDNRSAIFFSKDLGPIAQSINCMSADDFKRGEIKLVVQDPFWITDEVCAQQGSIFCVNRVSMSNLPNTEGVLLVGTFQSEDYLGRDDNLYLCAQGQISLRHKLFLKSTTTTFLNDAPEYFETTPPEIFVTQRCSSMNSSTSSTSSSSSSK